MIGEGLIISSGRTDPKEEVTSTWQVSMEYFREAIKKQHHPYDRHLGYGYGSSHGKGATKRLPKTYIHHIMFPKVLFDWTHWCQGQQWNNIHVKAEPLCSVARNRPSDTPQASDGALDLSHATVPSIWVDTIALCAYGPDLSLSRNATMEVEVLNYYPGYYKKFILIEGWTPSEVGGILGQTNIYINPEEALASATTIRRVL